MSPLHISAIILPPPLPPLPPYLYSKCSHSPGSAKNQYPAGKRKSRHSIMFTHFCCTVSLIRIHVKQTSGLHRVKFAAVSRCRRTMARPLEARYGARELRGSAERNNDSDQRQRASLGRTGINSEWTMWVCLPHRFLAQLSLLSPPVLTSADQDVAAT